MFSIREVIDAIEREEKAKGRAGDREVIYTRFGGIKLLYIIPASHSSEDCRKSRHEHRVVRQPAEGQDGAQQAHPPGRDLRPAVTAEGVENDAGRKQGR